MFRYMTKKTMQIQKSRYQCMIFCQETLTQKNLSFLILFCLDIVLVIVDIRMTSEWVTIEQKRNKINRNNGMGREQK